MSDPLQSYPLTINGAIGYRIQEDSTPQHGIITLTHPATSNNSIVFKVKTKFVDRYIVKSNKYVIDPGECVTVEITIIPDSIKELLTTFYNFGQEGLDQINDKFIIQCYTLTDEVASEMNNHNHTFKKLNQVLKMLLNKNPDSFSIASSITIPISHLGVDTRAERNKHVAELQERIKSLESQNEELKGGMDELSGKVHTYLNIDNSPFQNLECESSDDPDATAAQRLATLIEKKQHQEWVKKRLRENWQNGLKEQREAELKRDAAGEALVRAVGINLPSDGNDDDSTESSKQREADWIRTVAAREQVRMERSAAFIAKLKDNNYDPCKDQGDMSFDTLESFRESNSILFTRGEDIVGKEMQEVREKLDGMKGMSYREREEAFRKDEAEKEESGSLLTARSVHLHDRGRGGEVNHMVPIGNSFSNRDTKRPPPQEDKGSLSKDEGRVKKKAASSTVESAGHEVVHTKEELLRELEEAKEREKNAVSLVKKLEEALRTAQHDDSKLDEQLDEVQQTLNNESPGVLQQAHTFTYNPQEYSAYCQVQLSFKDRWDMAVEYLRGRGYDISDILGSVEISSGSGNSIYIGMSYYRQTARNSRTLETQQLEHVPTKKWGARHSIYIPADVDKPSTKNLIKELKASINEELGNDAEFNVKWKKLKELLKSDDVQTDLVTVGFDPIPHDKATWELYYALIERITREAIAPCLCLRQGCTKTCKRDVAFVHSDCADTYLGVRSSLVGSGFHFEFCDNPFSDPPAQGIKKSESGLFSSANGKAYKTSLLCTLFADSPIAATLLQECHERMEKEAGREKRRKSTVDYDANRYKMLSGQLDLQRDEAAIQPGISDEHLEHAWADAKLKIGCHMKEAKKKNECILANFSDCMRMPSGQPYNNEHFRSICRDHNPILLADDGNGGGERLALTQIGSVDEEVSRDGVRLTAQTYYYHTFGGRQSQLLENELTTRAMDEFPGVFTNQRSGGASFIKGTSMVVLTIVFWGKSAKLGLVGFNNSSTHTTLKRLKEGMTEKEYRLLNSKGPWSSKQR